MSSAILVESGGVGDGVFPTHVVLNIVLANYLTRVDALALLPSSATIFLSSMKTVKYSILRLKVAYTQGIDITALFYR